MTTPATDGEKKSHKRESRKWFVERITRDGKLAEWQARYQALRDEGMDFNKAWFKSAKEFSYVDGRTEKKHHDRWLLSQQTGVIQDRVPPERIRKEFDQVLESLPVTAIDPKVEINWIRNHPAMCRKARQGEEEPVVLTADDIRNAPNRAAAIQLINAANAPEDFNRNFAFLIKKMEGGADADKGNEVIPDPTLPEIERLLKEFTTES